MKNRTERLQVRTASAKKAWRARKAMLAARSSDTKTCVVKQSPETENKAQ